MEAILYPSISLGQGPYFKNLGISWVVQIGMKAQVNDMEMVKKNYEVPKKVAELIEKTSSRKGVSMQRIVATGAWVLCNMNPIDREEAVTQYADWLEDKAKSPLVTILSGQIQEVFEEFIAESLLSAHDAVEAMTLLVSQLDDKQFLEFKARLADWREAEANPQSKDAADRAALGRLADRLAADSKRKADKTA